MQTDADVYLFLLQLQINMLIQFSKRCCQYDYSFIDWVKTPTCVLPYGNTACTQPSEMLIEFILGIPCKRPKPRETRRIVSADLFFARRSLRESLAAKKERNTSARCRRKGRSIMSSPLFIFPPQLYNYDWIPRQFLGRGGNMRLVMTAVLEVRGKTVCGSELGGAPYSQTRCLVCVTQLPSSRILLFKE